ncbi:hypothetical protein [Xaviernesmea oryzae]|uniref:hypothetical protein n=1 Tax=Xaviernesmea oryzae TaxID=464029 RepID=UPI0011145B84|nr:hypothetical protein [Xaviernesmea oryzae]
MAIKEAVDFRVQILRLILEIEQKSRQALAKGNTLTAGCNGANGSHVGSKIRLKPDTYEPGEIFDLHDLAPKSTADVERRARAVNA